MPTPRPAKLKPLTDYLADLSGPPNLNTIERLLIELDISRQDLGDLVKFNDSSDRYARNAVAASGWYELLVVCWAPGQSSLIHDHAGSACAFKVIEGTGSETTYIRTKNGLAKPVSATVISQHDVCTSIDNDIHRVANDTDDRDLITLHLYAPPLALMNTYETEPDAENERKRLVADAIAEHEA